MRASNVVERMLCVSLELNERTVPLFLSRRVLSGTKCCSCAVKVWYWAHLLFIKHHLISSSGRCRYCSRTSQSSCTHLIQNHPHDLTLVSVFLQIPLEGFRRPGPTRIPKPKGFCSQKGTNGTAAAAANAALPSKTPGKDQAAHNNNNNPHLMNRRLWHVLKQKV